MSPEWVGDFSGLVAKSYDFSISYYQVNERLKRIIIVEMSYDNFEELTDDEAVGKATVPYEITFSFVPLSHKDLTIAFAFSWHFYVVLYLIVGFFAIINMLIFLLYHRLVIRPKNGKSFTKFKFLSYLKLQIRPALYGMGLALIPLVIGNFFISWFISGHIF